MQITLTENDAASLKLLLASHLPDLRREEAATELPARELRHELAKQVKLCERLLAELEHTAGSAAQV